MTNADRFKAIFGLYATELWAKPEKEFLKWLNADVPDTNVGDMISRQAAIDALKNVLVSEELEYAIPVLEELPSAEPESCEYWDAESKYCSLNRPSAQPERTCVNCGRTVNNGGWYADVRTRCPIEEHYALPKDGYCHLWEKRNITDDDYPERRTDELGNS